MKTLPTSALLAVPLLSLGTACCASPGPAMERVLTVEPLAPTGIEVRLKKTVVKSEQEAQALRFVSSPTVRIDGADVQSLAKETACGECSDLAGGGCGIECRVWPWRGTDHEAAPVGLLVEGVLRNALGAGEAGVKTRLRAGIAAANPPAARETAESGTAMNSGSVAADSLALPGDPQCDGGPVAPTAGRPDPVPEDLVGCLDLFLARVDPEERRALGHADRDGVVQADVARQLGLSVSEPSPGFSGRARRFGRSMSGALLNWTAAEE